MNPDIALLYFLNNFAGKSQIFDALTIFFASYLQYVFVAAFLLLLYFSAHAKHEKRSFFWTVALASIIARLGITEIIRFFYHRPRPFFVYQLHLLIINNAWSFPSCHAAFLFATATAIYLYHRKWGIWFFAGAMLVGISRVAAGAHYPSDVLGGMIVGILTAHLTFYLAKGRFKKYLAP